MSSQHKLYNYEVSPPADTWNRIAQELDGVNEYKNVSAKLQNLTIAPPATLWDKIHAALDEEQSFDIIAQKLSSMAIAPPAGAWHKIEAGLVGTLITKKKSASVVPFRTRLLRFATAAALLGIIVLAVYFMVQRSSQDAAAIQKNIVSADISVITGQPATAGNVQKRTHNLPAQPHVLTGTADLQTLAATAPQLQANAAVVTSKGNAYITSVEKNQEIDGRYIVLMTEEGNVVRMSKKVSNMADCISGQDHSSECNTQIAAWQKEMASLPVLASPDNILSLLELATKEPTTGL